MRNVRVETSAPTGAIRLVGVLDGQILDDTTVTTADLEMVGFTGSKGEVQAVVADTGPAMFVGLGSEIDANGLMEAVAAAVRKAPDQQTLVTTLHTLDLEGAITAVVLGARLASYRFDEFRNGETTQTGDLVLFPAADTDEVDGAVLISDGVARARDWVNRPPAHEPPDQLAAEMAELLTAVGYDVEVWDEDRIAAEKLGGLEGVARGSNRPPRMVVAHKKGSGRHLALVGKGIVFDSGGLSIKPASGMTTMKSDMAGGAAVAAAAGVIGELGLDLSVSVFIPLTDNMPGGSATKPGDVLTARNGKTIEVLNTDAEGRLVLADGLSLAVEQSPDLVVDVATLTGASRVALGDHIAALFASSEDASAAVATAAERAGERIWPMPLPADYRPMIDSKVADMKNVGGRSGGAITAALFLSEFVGDTPWVHLDIAAPAWSDDDRDTGRSGGTGFGVRTLVSLAEGMVNHRTESVS